jgi:hypothetical protein
MTVHIGSKSFKNDDIKSISKGMICFANAENAYVNIGSDVKVFFVTIFKIRIGSNLHYKVLDLS